MMMLIVICCLMAMLVVVQSMPYLVPLQGIVGGKRTLCILDDMTTISSHSIFFDNIKSRGHEITFIQAESPHLTIKKYGEYLYDNIIIFAPTVDEFSSITVDDILEFSNNGGNILIAANENISDTIRSLTENVGIEFDQKKSVVIDHFQYSDKLDNDMTHTTILASNVVNSNIVIGKYANNKLPLLYRGIGHAIDDNNILAMKVLRGNPSSYSANPSVVLHEYPSNAGEDTLLITTIQARNNARILVSGSLDFFSNSFFELKNYGNEVFCDEISKWVFGESGVLRYRDITHHKSDGTPPDVILHEKERPDLPISLYPDPEITRNSLVYRIKDEIVFKMTVELLVDGQWVPFSADDMQMEFVMLDPYVRKSMTSNPKTGDFIAIFNAPDSYGVFKFRVFYRRQGYSVLHSETPVSVRPFKHNEYERFIFSAFPYYSSAFSAMIAFVSFSLFFVFSK